MSQRPLSPVVVVVVPSLSPVVEVVVSPVDDSVPDEVLVPEALSLSLLAVVVGSLVAESDPLPEEPLELPADVMVIAVIPEVAESPVVPVSEAELSPLHAARREREATRGR